jgi:CheY-like chemotaxis protein
MLVLYYLLLSYHRRLEKKNKSQIELLEIEKERELYEAKIEFFTNIAHEIRTPLTLIKGPLEKVIKITKDIPEIHYNLGIMNKNTSRLLELADQLLDFRKTETKGFSLSFTHTDIKALVRETYLRFKPMAEQNGFDFRLQLPSDPIYAYVDREALTKILSNLFSNALKYGDNKVGICLPALEDTDQYFRIIIKNDGHLLMPEVREKIFTPFFRVPKTENKPGTGIGLPLSRSLAELHNGTLELKLPEDNLNTFVLKLPLHQDKEYKLFDKLEAEAINIKHEENFSGVKTPILIVEDNVEMLEFIANELSDEYLIFKAGDGKTALEILNEEIIQLIVCDIMMPNLNGIELCKTVKSTIDFSHIPVILLTAKNNLQAKIEGLESGADAYMEKPFSIEHLRVQLANLLTNRNKIKDFFSQK